MCPLSTNTSFILGLRAQALNLEIDDVVSNLPILNDIIFGAFTDLVSDNIFDLLSKEDL